MGVAAMNEIQHKLRQAQRRLWLNRWLNHLSWSLAIAAGLFVAFVLVVRLVGLFADQEGRALWRAFAILTGSGILASILWTWLTRDSLALAAARLDQAAHLQERLSTAIAFAGSSDPFAKAAVADADQVSRKVSPKIYLPVHVPRSASYAASAFLMALMVSWLFPVIDLSNRQAAQAEDARKQEEIKKAQVTVQPIVQKLQEIEAKHPELKKEPLLADPLKNAKLETPADYKREAIKQINTAAAKIDQKKNQSGLTKMEEFKSSLRRLAAQPAPTSTAGNLSKSLAKGDFKGAQAALDAIRQELKKVPENEADQARIDQIRKDLKKISEQLDQLAQDSNKLKEMMQQANISEEDIQKMLEKMDKGDLDAISKMLADMGLTQEQANKIAQQAEKSAASKKAAKQLAQSLSKAAQPSNNQQGQKNQQGKQGQKGQQGQQGQGDQGQQGQQGQGSGQKGQGQGQGQGSSGQGDGDGDGESDDSKEGFTQAQEQLSELEQLEQEMAELNASSAQLQDLKDELGDSSCSACGGKGCAQCNGTGRCGGGKGNGGNGPGMGGLGRGQGGVASVNPVDFSLTQKKAPVYTRPGAIISQKFEEGEQYKGEVSENFVEAVLGAREDLTEANRQKTKPRHIKLLNAEYFKHVEKDLPTDKVDAAKKKLDAQNPAEAAPSP